jgi:hypothetical protein
MIYGQVQDAEAVNNRKMWIILGSVIGLLVIVMGGCVACGAIVGLSSLSSGGAAGSPSTGSREWGFGGGLSGTTWKGHLTCDDNSEDEYTLKFSSNGNPFYLYQSSSGLHEEELTGEGQSFKFPPAGGGATYVNVESLEVSSERVNYTLRVSHERAAGGTMIQSRRVFSVSAALSGSKLMVDITINSNAAASQPDYVTSDGSVTKCHAELSKE